MRHPLLLLVTAAFMLTLQACATREANLVRSNHAAADNLLTMASASLDKAKPLLVASLMDVGDLTSTSRFGRITADMLASRLAQNGYTVLEIKLDRENLYTLTGTGEMLLSNALRNLSATIGAQAVLIGTYAPASERVFVSAKLVRASDNVILAAEDYSLPHGRDVAALIDPDTAVMAVGPNYRIAP